MKKSEYNGMDVYEVESTNYCVKSKNEETVTEMNRLMGYHNMADKANNKKFPAQMEGAKRNVQIME